MLNRRQVLQNVVAGSVAVSAETLFSASPASRSSSLIATENSRTPTRDWMLSSTRIDPATKYRCPWVEGFCSHASIQAGETLQVFASTRESSQCALDIFRLGHYDGAGGRLMLSMQPRPCAPQPDPPIGNKRMRNCQWAPFAEIAIPEDWLSGVYVGKLTESHEGLQSYVIFIVRDNRRADYLFQCSDHTWQAYNRWPDQFSLYDDGKNTWYWGGEIEISFNRPYGKYCQIVDQPLSIGSGDFFLWEYPFLYWLESQGYDVSYISNVDTHRDGVGLQRAKGFLSVGHDEYWTIDMFRNVQRALTAGVNLGFFSGNAVCGRVQYDPVNRSIERVGVFGPPGGTREFTSMSTLKHERPYANELIGAHSTGPVTGGADWICSLSEHWLYHGTDMHAGDSVPGLIGWEWHGDPAGIEGLQIVATGATQSEPGKLNGGQYTATVYPGPRDNFVFNAATCWWADGLSEPPGYVRPQVYTSPQGPDRRVQQMTHNILQRMILGSQS